MYVLRQALGWWAQLTTCTASRLRPLLKGRSRVAAGWPASTGLLTSSVGLVLQAPTLLWVQLHNHAPVHTCLCMQHKVCVSLCEPRVPWHLEGLKGKTSLFSETIYYLWFGKVRCVNMNALTIAGIHREICDEHLRCQDCTDFPQRQSQESQLYQSRCCFFEETLFLCSFKASCTLE